MHMQGFNIVPFTDDERSVPIVKKILFQEN
jgi:hypothetical protein